VARLISASPLRATPPCPIYAECGGCQLQHLAYEAQLDAKTRIVADALRSIGGLREVAVGRCLPTPQWAYRNKMQLVAARGGRLGLYRRHTHRVVPMDDCLIAHPLANRILATAPPILRDLGWSAWDERTGRGLLRHLLARVAATLPGEGPPSALVVPIVSADGPTVVRDAERLAKALAERVPEVAGLLLNVNPDRTNVVLGRRTIPVWGADHLIETVRGVKFRVGATSFFQVNTEGLALLSERVEEFLAPTPEHVVLDAYCGVGAFALLLAARCREVIGIEEVAEAIDNARHNALLNGLSNTSFRCGTVESLVGEIPRLDAAVLDPPRKGCAPAVLEALVAREVARIAYVSCNPATLARDLAVLTARGYRVESVQPVDMFPQTSHVECLARVTRIPTTTR
jgi:23S rRNA (uracil1939-C5)-methyltransferase